MPLTTCFPFYSTPKNKRPAAMVADRRTSGPLPAGSTPCGPHRGRFHAPDRMTWGVCRRVRTRTAAGAYLLPQPPPAGSTPCGPHLEVPAGVRRYLPTPPPPTHTPACRIHALRAAPGPVLRTRSQDWRAYAGGGGGREEAPEPPCRFTSGNTARQVSCPDCRLDACAAACPHFHDRPGSAEHLSRGGSLAVFQRVFFHREPFF